MKSRPLKIIVIFLGTFVLLFLSLRLNANVSGHDNSTKTEQEQRIPQFTINGSEKDSVLSQMKNTRFGKHLPFANGSGDLFFSSDVSTDIPVKVIKALEFMNIVTETQRGSFRIGRKKDGFYLSAYIDEKEINKETTVTYFQKIGKEPVCTFTQWQRGVYTPVFNTIYSRQNYPYFPIEVM